MYAFVRGVQGGLMVERLNFGGQYTVNIDVEFEIREDYTPADVKASEEELKSLFCKQIEEWLKDGLEYVLDGSEYSVKVDRVSDYHKIKVVTDDGKSD